MASTDTNAEHQQMVQDCEQRESQLGDWDRQFIDSVGHQLAGGRTLSPKQAAKLEEIWQRVTTGRGRFIR